MTNNDNHADGHMSGNCNECASHHGGHWRKKLGMGFILLAVTGSLFLAALFATTLKQYHYIGRDINSQTTITVSGDGDAYAMPDIATVSFSITQEAKLPADARKAVDDRMKKIHAFLTASKIDEKDIKTTGYNLYPKYEWSRSATVCPVSTNGMMYPCNPDGKQVLTGYEVSQSVDVKIRDLDSAGSVLGGLTDNGASNVSGLSFTVEHEDAVQAQAREAAIAKAKDKAQQLANDLGVTLVRIVSFNEGGNYPVYNYAMGASMKTMSADATPPSAANIPTGENKYVSNVSIVYEIR